MRITLSINDQVRFLFKPPQGWGKDFYRCYHIQVFTQVLSCGVGINPVRPNKGIMDVSAFEQRCRTTLPVQTWLYELYLISLSALIPEKNVAFLSGIF